MPNIENQVNYLSSMRKSLYDKAFFIDKIFEPINTIFDYGCADGSLIKFIDDIVPKTYSFAGYDNSKEMIKVAKSKGYGLNVFFTTNLKHIRLHPDTTLLNLSSVIHEVYSYCTDNEIEEFWRFVFDTGFKYIAIRDMMIHDAAKKSSTYTIPLNVKKVTPILIDSFDNYCNYWGRPHYDGEWIHYFLKSQYYNNGNWSREVQENYLPITKEELKDLIPSNYEIVYEDHYVLPYFQYYMEKTFGFKLNCPTHYKLLLKKKD